MNQVLIEFKEMVDDLQATSSRLEKENILRKHNNEDIKEILNFIFNPYIITGISKKKILKYKDKLDLDKLNIDIKEIMQYFKVHNSGRDEDLKWLEISAGSFNDTYKDLIYKIISKDIKLGIQPITLNKVYGEGFIPTFDVMLAQRYFENPDKLLPDGTDFILTTKLDGVRCVCINSEDGPKFFSRQGQVIEGLVELEKEMKELPFDVYDGELLLNKEGLESKDLYRETVKVTSSDGIKKNINYNVFDILSIKDFMDNSNKQTCADRKNLLNNFIKNANTKYIRNVDILYKGTDKSQIEYWLDKITSSGGEGVMINLSDGYYECKRSKNLLKVKKFQTADVHVIDIEEGTGINSNKLGAVKVEFLGPDNKIYTCKVGSGFKQEEREYYWNHKDEILNKIIEIAYFEISNNQQNNEYSLRFPTFKYIRNDKTEISMY